MLQQIPDSEIENLIVEILYRPFDRRYIFWHRSLTWRPVEKVMKHMLSGENLGLITTRIIKSGFYKHCLVANIPVDNCFISNQTAERGYLFPLYLYTDSGKIPNFTDKFTSYIRELYGKELSPEEIFYYIYAVLYSPDYRKRYGELLKYEFPRIPFFDDYEKLRKFAELGKELIDLHLLKSPSLNAFSVKFEGEGNNKVERISHKSEKVYINDVQYFYPVKKEIWEYKIGGYQVLKKWLSDRKGRILGYEDIKTYLKIVKVIEETLRIQENLSRLVYT